MIVRPVADAPEARNVSASGDEDTPMLVFFDAQDADGDALTFSRAGPLTLQPGPGAALPDTADTG
ncbi:MAG: hypothetical protein ACK559_30665, partial [bacterium]